MLNIISTNLESFESWNPLNARIRNPLKYDDHEYYSKQRKTQVFLFEPLFGKRDLSGATIVGLVKTSVGICEMHDKHPFQW